MVEAAPIRSTLSHLHEREASPTCFVCAKEPRPAACHPANAWPFSSVLCHFLTGV